MLHCRTHNLSTDKFHVGVVTAFTGLQGSIRTPRAEIREQIQPACSPIGAALQSCAWHHCTCVRLLSRCNSHSSIAAFAPVVVSTEMLRVSSFCPAVM
jgi:hypothetical protein